jgi:cyanate lyase
MPSTNEEAARELDDMRKSRDLTYAWVARRIGKNEMWVRRRLNGAVSMKIGEYTLLRDAIRGVPLSGKGNPTI